MIYFKMRSVVRGYLSREVVCLKRCIGRGCLSQKMYSVARFVLTEEECVEMGYVYDVCVKKWYLFQEVVSDMRRYINQ